MDVSKFRDGRVSFRKGEMTIDRIMLYNFLRRTMTEERCLRIINEQ